MPLRAPDPRRVTILVSLVTGLALALACATDGPASVRIHGWWSGLGPVVPHDSFPGDCRSCHEGSGWNDLTPEFQFDHEAETGVALNGAHQFARCLRCHNDRGPVQVFATRGCSGCHEDLHQGMLGANCTQCHTETSWNALAQTDFHDRTRFPLTGIHAVTSCRRCHPGFEVGRFTHTDVECLTCHQDDLARALNPAHVGLGFVDRCDRCHIPTSWNQAELDP